MAHQYDNLNYFGIDRLENDDVNIVPTESQLTTLAAIAQSLTEQWGTIDQPEALSCIIAGWAARSGKGRYVLTSSGRELLRLSNDQSGMDGN